MTGITRSHVRAGAIAAHAALAGALCATLGGLGAAVWLRFALLALGLLPLAASLRGLLGLRLAALRWLALALVLYAGLGSVEVVATGTAAAAAVLLFALLELGFVLILLRHPLAPARGAREGP